MNKLTSFIFWRYSQLSREGLSARKYMRSVTQTALLYKPKQIVQLPELQSKTDRVVQTFFDSSKYRIKVFQAAKRLSSVSEYSTPAHSFYQVILPFQSNDKLRKKMVQFYNTHIRVGRVLQLMDYIAANVAYRYCSVGNENKKLQSLSFYTVTASIDQIDFFHPIHAELDCTFSGYVSHVGSSSMQVQIDVLQKIKQQPQERLACSAKFVMVARDKQNGKAYKVPPLNISEQQNTFKYKIQLGKKRQIIRKDQAKKTLKITPPTYEQSSNVHNLMLRVDKQKNIQWIKMDTTIQKNTLLMHLQDKNLSGKIFGGFIMRLAFELGWLTAYKFLKTKYPKCTHIDDVQFLGPVQIGTSIELEATVAYVNDEIVHVIVQCFNRNKDCTRKLTNVLRISFEYKDTDKENIETATRIVYPQTLKQTMQYIQSMRRVIKYLED